MKIITDKKRNVIREFDLLKVFHFTGFRGKKHYVYKWVRINQGELYGCHLADASGEGFFLWILAPDGMFKDAEIIQTRPGNSD